MKFICILLLLCFFNSHAYKPECHSLAVKLNEQDKMDANADAAYGDGDDDLFAASEMGLSVGGRYNQNIQRLNDYDLTKVFVHSFKPAAFDTIQMVVYFPGLKRGNEADTMAIINEIDIFDGNRSDMSAWTRSGCVKDIAVLHNGVLLGCATLQHSYKMQTISLQNAAIINKRGKADTISVVVTSIYQGSISGPQYAVSEIKLNGVRKY